MASSNNKFNLASCFAGKKRASTGTTTVPAPFKVPKASDVKILEMPRPQQQPRRLPASAPVTVCMYKYTDSAGDVIQRFIETL